MSSEQFNTALMTGAYPSQISQYNQMSLEPSQALGSGPEYNYYSPAYASLDDSSLQVPQSSHTQYFGTTAAPSAVASGTAVIGNHQSYIMPAISDIAFHAVNQTFVPAQQQQQLPSTSSRGSASPYQSQQQQQQQHSSPNPHLPNPHPTNAIDLQRGQQQTLEQQHSARYNDTSTSSGQNFNIGMYVNPLPRPAMQ